MPLPKWPWKRLFSRSKVRLKDGDEHQDKQQNALQYTGHCPEPEGAVIVAVVKHRQTVSGGDQGEFLEPWTEVEGAEHECTEGQHQLDNDPAVPENSPVGQEADQHAAAECYCRGRLYQEIVDGGDGVVDGEQFVSIAGQPV